MTVRGTTWLAPWTAVLLVLGCAWPDATAKGMTLAKEELSAAPNPTLASAMHVAEVNGEQTTEPHWVRHLIDNDRFKEALTESLRSAGLLSEKGDGRYEICASLVRVTHLLPPFFPHVPLPYLDDITVRTEIRYTVKDRTQGSVVFEELISAWHTVTLGEATFRGKRHRLANEGSAKKNIAVFINKLNGLKLKDMAVSIGS